MKSNRKIIALFVTLAFVFLLQASAMPLRADPAPASAETTVSSPEQGPGVIEEEGSTAGPVRKKSILPIIIGVVAVGAIAAFIALVVLKTKYDIVGTWEFAFTSTTPAHTWTWSLVFSGDKKSGTFSDAGDTGKYTVEDKNVSIQYDDWNIVLTGKFDSKDKMTGSGTFAGLTIGGKSIASATWTATRLSSSGSLRPGEAAIQSQENRKARQ